MDKFSKRRKRTSCSYQNQPRKSIILPYIQALRPRQWTKNLIIFAAPLFAFSLTLETLFGSIIAFVLFCCASSSFYLFNDIADVESDRAHPVKCQRPIAAELVKVPVAIAIALILLTSALILGWLQSPLLGLVLLGYALLQVAYNLKLKHTVIADIMAIAMGFVLRACAGAAATELPISPWFILCTAMLALFLAIEKRKAELRLAEAQGKKTRAVLWRYSHGLLMRMENSVTTGTILTYVLWSAGPVVQGAPTLWMMVTIPFVLYGVFRYQFLSDPKESAILTQTGSIVQKTERPDEVLLKDLPILLNVTTWVATVFIILLLNDLGIIQ